MTNIKRVVSLGLTRSGTAIADVPDTPTIGTATDVGTSRPLNNGAATVTASPSATGGIPTSYTVTSSPGGYSATSTSPVTVTGLQIGVSYTFTAVANTTTGSSPASTSSSNSITATTVPGSPTITSAVDVGTSRPYNNGAATISFNAPANNGGKSITSYTVTSSGPTVTTASGSSSPITITGLSFGTYTFTIAAVNANGTGQPSGSSTSISVTTVPDQPTNVTSLPTYDSRNISVSFTDPADGGKTPTYTVTASPGGATQTGSSPVTFSNLTLGSSYTFTVAASNANGNGNVSSASGSTYPIDIKTSSGSVNSTTSTTPVLASSLSASSTDNAPTAFFWTGNTYSTNSVALDLLVKIASGSGVVSDVVTQNMEPQDLNDVIHTGGFYYSSSYPSANSIYQYGWVETASSTGTFNTRLLRLCLDSGSVATYNENSVTNALATSTSACSNITVPTNGNYLLIATGSVNVSSASATSSQVFVRETGPLGPVPGPTITASQQTPIVTTDTTNYFPYWYIQKISNKSGYSYSLEFLSGNTAYTATMKGSGLMLINLDAFKAHYYDEPADVTTTSVSGANIGRTSTFSISSPSNGHIVFASAFLTGTNTSYYSESVIINRDTSAYTLTHRREPNLTTEEYPFVVGEIWKDVDSQVDWRLYTQNAAGTAGLKSMRICIIDTGIAGSNFP